MCFCRASMMEGSGTLEDQLEATKVRTQEIGKHYKLYPLILRCASIIYLIDLHVYLHWYKSIVT